MSFSRYTSLVHARIIDAPVLCAFIVHMAAKDIELTF